MKRTLSFALSLIFLISSAFTEDRPNVVVIMVDDLGYSDIGCYGGEIETPNLDALAEGGLRFSQFYNTAKCHSSRVSLLTGQYCIAAGDVALSHAVTSAEVLGEAGYFTAMTGKWHLEQEPTDFGFRRYFGHLSGACNFFKGDNTFRLNGEKWKVPANDFYTTVADVDFALDFLKEARDSKQPYYLYVAFNAPHAPLHALPEDYAKYKGRYDEGWDSIRDARIAKQKKLGLLPEELTPSPRPPHVRAWDKLVPWQRDYEINRMVTLAAMIDRVDQEIGRLVENLRSHGELDNTMILFVSDNGACPYDRKKPLLDVEPTNGDVSLADSTGWSWARNAPFRFYKQNQFEGGISTPGIVHWPAGLKTEPGSIVDTPAHLIDVLPTLADLAGAEIPDEHANRELRPVSGVSLRPIFEDKTLERPEPIYLQFATDYGLRDGGWKLVSFKGQEWELYHVANDRTELNNLADSEPERLQAMVEKWRTMSRDVLHSEKLANTKMKPAEDPKANREWTVFSDSPEPPINKRSGKDSPGSGIRARKNTQLTVKPGAWELTFTGEDPGVAIDLRNVENLTEGPYVLEFELTTNWKGIGEVFYTIDGKTSLPRGNRIEYAVEGTETAQKIRIDLDTEEQIHQLRIDVSDGTGTATIKNLQLRNASGVVFPISAKPREPSLQIGWASADITPLGSAKMRGGIDSAGTLDPIKATALALEKPRPSEESDTLSEAVVLVSCDLQHITDGNRYEANMRDDVRALVTASIPELNGEQIILMATHTHVAPSVQSDPEYKTFASQRIAEAVIQAWEQRAKGGISYGLGHAVAGHNRIATYSDGSSHMTGSFQNGSTGNPKFTHLEGFEDHSVNLLFTWDHERNLTGVIANIACPAQVQRGDKISADYWHEVRGNLREEFGPGVALLPQISAAGDIATTVMVERKGEKRMQQLRFPNLDDERAQRRKEIARRITSTIAETLPVVKSEIDFSPVLHHSFAKIELESGFPEPDSEAPRYPIEVHAVRLADVAIVTNPFELYLDYGIRMKGRSPAVQTFVVQLAGSASYLPTERAVRQSGYGAIEKTCVVGPKAGERIVSETLKLIESHWDSPEHESK